MTYNRARLRLYKEPKLYNGSRYTKYFASESERDSYFANPDLDLGEIQYNSTDGTINVQRNLGVLLEYSYGILTVMDTDMYIFIDDIQVGYNDVSTIYYSIDYFETARFKFQVTKGHLTRYNGSKPQYMAQPYSPYVTTIDVLEQITNKGCFVFTFFDSRQSQLATELRVGICDINSYTMAVIQLGTWQESWGLIDGDIVDCFVVPFITTDDISNDSAHWQPVTEEGGTYIYYYVSQGFVSSITKTISLSDLFTTDEKSVKFLADWCGNKIWECPINYDFNTISLRIDIGTTHTQIHGTVYDSNSDIVTFPYLSENNAQGFCYECRHVSLFVDSYSEYVMRQRDYDIEARQIQNEMEFYKGLVGTAEAAGYGTAFGGGIGGVASLAGGLAETFGTAIINQTYAPKLQALEDKKYQLMQDEMSVVGDAISSLKYCIGDETGTDEYKPSLFYVVSLKMDTSSEQRMDNDISINGYHCDETVSDIDSMISTGTIIQADNVVIEGTISAQYRIDIADRFSRGIEFI